MRFEKLLVRGVVVIGAMLGCVLSQAQVTSPVKPPRHAATTERKSAQTDTKRLFHLLFPSMPARFPWEFRSIDGSGNNVMHPDWGMAGSELLRAADTAYADGSGTPAGSGRDSARAISNGCAAQTGSMPNSRGVSSMVWQWGQFIDHDITLVGTMDPIEPFDIEVPVGDPYFDPNSTGTQAIALERSFYHMVGGVRQQVDELTAYIDGSQVYGSDEARATALRMLDGTGRLKTSEGQLLPYNTEEFENAFSNDSSFFFAGDIRANEQVALTCMQTLFMREHNRWAKRIHRAFPMMDGDRVYLWARALVGAEIQSITYNEFLPILLGPGALEPYTGYKPDVQAGIMNEFATAAYRVGHTFLPPELERLDATLQPIPEGSLPLANAFFNPDEYKTIGIEPYLRGLASQMAQEVDTHVVDGVRNFLFGPPGAGGFDLASLNIQRGRDHGLPDYNSVRVALGLPARAGFTEITSNTDAQAALASMYSSVDDIDLWVAGLAEDHMPGAMVGETFWTIIKMQFERLRDSDRFWYQAYLPPHLMRMVEKRTLRKIIGTNTEIRGELQKDVFMVPPSP